MKRKSILGILTLMSFALLTACSVEKPTSSRAQDGKHGQNGGNGGNGSNDWNRGGNGGNGGDG
jgi:hypothetical protein